MWERRYYSKDGDVEEMKVWSGWGFHVGLVHMTWQNQRHWMGMSWTKSKASSLVESNTIFQIWMAPRGSLNALVKVLPLKPTCCGVALITEILVLCCLTFLHFFIFQIPEVWILLKKVIFFYEITNFYIIYYNAKFKQIYKFWKKITLFIYKIVIFM